MSATNPPTVSSTPQSAPSTPTTYYGQTASVVASMIKGCTGVAVGDAKDGAKSGMASTATCSLGGRLVDVNTWSSADAEAGVEAVIAANKTEAYYAKGLGWTVTTHDSGTLQMQLTNDASGLLEQGLGSSPAPTAAVDVPGQKKMANAVVASLGGQVEHVVS